MIDETNRSKFDTTNFFARKTDNQKKNLILVGFIFLILLHAIFVVVGFYKNDDLNYARHAAMLAKHGHLLTPATSHFQLRWTIIFVTAFFYKLFGISAFTSTLCPFISICLCGILLK